MAGCDPRASRRLPRLCVLVQIHAGALCCGLARDLGGSLGEKTYRSNMAESVWFKGNLRWMTWRLIAFRGKHYHGSRGISLSHHLEPVNVPDLKSVRVEGPRSKRSYLMDRGWDVIKSETVCGMNPAPPGIFETLWDRVNNGKPQVVLARFQPTKSRCTYALCSSETYRVHGSVFLEIPENLVKTVPRYHRDSRDLKIGGPEQFLARAL